MCQERQVLIKQPSGAGLQRLTLGIESGQVSDTFKASPDIHLSWGAACRSAISITMPWNPK